MSNNTGTWAGVRRLTQLLPRARFVSTQDRQLRPYRRLARQLHHSLPSPGSRRSVVLVSPTDSSLAAQGATALARCMVEELRRPVLLVDAVPEKRELSTLLRCNGSRGIAELLAGSDPAELQRLALPTTSENLSFLPAGGSVAPDRTTSDAIKNVLDAAEQGYDFVVVAGGSVLDDPSGLAAAPHVGCVLLLVAEHQTKIEDLDLAQEALSLCNASRVGLLLTTGTGPR